MERVAREHLKQSAECPIHRHILSVNRCVKRLWAKKTFISELFFPPPKKAGTILYPVKFALAAIAAFKLWGNVDPGIELFTVLSPHGILKLAAPLSVKSLRTELDY